MSDTPTGERAIGLWTCGLCNEDYVGGLQECPNCCGSHAPVQPVAETREPEGRYEVQHGAGIDGFRITDRSTDSRVATCYLRENAKLVCDALNALHRGPETGADPSGDIPSGVERNHEVDSMQGTIASRQHEGANE